MVCVCMCVMEGGRELLVRHLNLLHSEHSFFENFRHLEIIRTVCNVCDCLITLDVCVCVKARFCFYASIYLSLAPLISRRHILRFTHDFQPAGGLARPWSAPVVRHADVHLLSAGHASPWLLHKFFSLAHCS